MKTSILFLFILPVISLFSKNTLEPGETLQRGESLVSPNGLYRLVLQDDGNLVLYQKNEAMWFTGTQGQAIKELVMQPDGNAVLYKYSGASAWNTNTERNPNSCLTLQNDGNLVIYKRIAIFATNTAKK